jgi:SAM-dependent methyltransferase
MSRAASYDAIAALYDDYWGQTFAVLARESFQQHLSPLLPAGAAVLDLCCGTGLFMAHLGSLGFEAYGVDESSKMLRAARRNAPRAKLQQADMAEFHAGRNFDAVVSFYNSMNHAPSVEHLRATMANVARHLPANGHFLFDYVLPDAFESAWEWTEKIEGWTFRYTYEKSSGRATCLVNERDAIRQSSFEAREIHEALSDAGFVVVEESQMIGSAPLGSRKLVLAKKLAVD